MGVSTETAAACLVLIGVVVASVGVAMVFIPAALVLLGAGMAGVGLFADLAPRPRGG